MDRQALLSAVQRQRRVERYDYFLIWGHGLPHRDAILAELRAEPTLELLKIVRHDVADIKHFVDVVYSYDYAPIEHLRGKTQYLLNTEPRVVFIFLRNLQAEEAMVGEGPFRHVESQNIKRLKERIRDRFNPRSEGRRTEDHVVHASDNQLQTHVMLKHIGFTNGVAAFNSANPVVAAPGHLRAFNSFELRSVPLASLVASLAVERGGRVESALTELEDTPHYRALDGDTAPYEAHFRAFDAVLTDDHSWQKLDAMNANFSYASGDHATDYIITRRLDDGRYLIMDGLHRSSMLKKRGIEEALILVVNP